MMQRRPRLAGWCWVLFLASVCRAGPINREAGLDNDLHNDKRNETYDSELHACVFDDVLYRAGDLVPAGTSCKRCVCQPPGFTCAPVVCEMKPGCKALQKPNQCCPEYQCECEKNGRVYQNGEKLENPENPCDVCYCQGGDVVCTTLECYLRDDCEPQFVPGRCCPKYDHCPPIELQRTNRPQYTRSTFEPTSEDNVTDVAQKPVSANPEHDQDIGASNVHLLQADATPAPSTHDSSYLVGSTPSVPGTETPISHIHEVIDTGNMHILEEQTDKTPPPSTSDTSILIDSTLSVLPEEKQSLPDREDDQDISTSNTHLLGEQSDKIPAPSTDSDAEDDSSSSDDSSQSVPIDDSSTFNPEDIQDSDVSNTHQSSEQVDKTGTPSTDSSPEDVSSQSADSTESVHAEDKPTISNRDGVHSPHQLLEQADVAPAPSTNSSSEDDLASHSQQSEHAEKSSILNDEGIENTDTNIQQGLLNKQKAETSVYSTGIAAEDKSDSLIGSTQSGIAEKESLTHPSEEQANETTVSSIDTSIEEESSSFVGSTTLESTDKKSIGVSNKNIMLLNERVGETAVNDTSEDDNIHVTDITLSDADDQDIGASNTQNNIHLLNTMVEETPFTELALDDEAINVLGTTSPFPTDGNTMRSDPAEDESNSTIITNSREQQIGEEVKEALLEDKVSEEVTTANYAFTTESMLADNYKTPEEIVEHRSGIESGSGEFSDKDSSEEGSGSTSHDSDVTDISSASMESSTQTDSAKWQADDKSEDNAEGSGIQDVESTTGEITLPTLIYGNTNIEGNSSGTGNIQTESETDSESSGPTTLDYSNNENSSELSGMTEELATIVDTDSSSKYDSSNGAATSNEAENHDTTPINNEHTTIYNEQQTLATTPTYGIIERINLQIDPSYQTSTGINEMNEEAQTITTIYQLESATEVVSDTKGKYSSQTNASILESDEEYNDKSNGLKVTGDFLTESFTETSSASNETSSDSESTVSNESSSDVDAYSSLEYKHDIIEGVQVSSVYAADDLTGANIGEIETTVNSEITTEVNEIGKENYKNEPNSHKIDTTELNIDTTKAMYDELSVTDINNGTETRFASEEVSNSDDNLQAINESDDSIVKSSELNGKLNAENNVTNDEAQEITVEPGTEIMQPTTMESGTNDLTSLPSSSNKELKNEGNNDNTTLNDEAEESTTINTITNASPEITKENISNEEVINIAFKDHSGEDMLLDPVLLHDSDDELPVLMIGDELANHQMDVVMATPEMMSSPMREPDVQHEQNNIDDPDGKAVNYTDTTSVEPASTIDIEGTTTRNVDPIGLKIDSNNDTEDVVTDAIHIMMNDSPVSREAIAETNGSEELNTKFPVEERILNDTLNTQSTDNEKPSITEESFTTHSTQEESSSSTQTPKMKAESPQKVTSEISNFEDSAKTQLTHDGQLADKEIQEISQTETSSSDDSAPVACIHSNCLNNNTETELQGHSFEISNSDDTTTEDISSNTQGLFNDELLLTQKSSEVLTLDDSATDNNKTKSEHTIGGEVVLDITTFESSSSEDTTTEIHIYDNQYQKESTIHSDPEDTSSESLSSATETYSLTEGSDNEALQNDGPVLRETHSEDSSTTNSDDEITSSTEIAEIFMPGSITNKAEEVPSLHQKSSEASGEFNTSEMDSVISKILENSTEVISLIQNDNNSSENKENIKIIADVVPLKHNATEHTQEKESETISPDWLKHENDTSDSSLIGTGQESSADKLGSTWNNTSDELVESVTIPQDWLKVGNEQKDDIVTNNKSKDDHITTVGSVDTENQDLKSTTVTGVKTTLDVEEHNHSTTKKAFSDDGVETTLPVQEIDPLMTVTTFDESVTELVTETTGELGIREMNETSLGAESNMQLTIDYTPKDSNASKTTAADGQSKGGSAGDGDAVDKKDLYILQDFFKKLYRHENSEETTVL